MPTLLGRFHSNATLARRRVVALVLRRFVNSMVAIATVSSICAKLSTSASSRFFELALTKESWADDDSI